MKKKIMLKLLLCVVLVLGVCFALSGCSSETGDAKHQICVALKINDIPEFTLESHQSGTGKDVEEYYIISFSSENAEKFKSQNLSSWSNTPVISEFKNFTDYASIIPETTIDLARQKLTALNTAGNRYYFYDGTYDFTVKYADKIKGERVSTIDETPESIADSGWFSTEDPRSSKYAIGFSCGFFEESTNKLYVYCCEKTYSRELLKYIEK